MKENMLIDFVAAAVAVDIGIAGIADVVLIHVRLVGIGGFAAVVAGIAHVVEVGVLLERVGAEGAVVRVVGDAVAIAVRGARDPAHQEDRGERRELKEPRPAER